MHLFAITFVLTVHLNGFKPTGWDASVDPVFWSNSEPPQIALVARGYGAVGMAIPNFFWLDTSRSPEDPSLVLQEEYTHTRQMAALGPGFFVAYAATWGQPFEPYNPRDLANRSYSLQRMWHPKDANRCPMFDFGSDGIHFERCYTGLIHDIFTGQHPAFDSTPDYASMPLGNVPATYQAMQLEPYPGNAELASATP